MYSQYNMSDPAAPPVNEETVGHLRQRLNVMRDIVKVGSKQDSILNDTRNVFCFFQWYLHYVASKVLSKRQPVYQPPPASLESLVHL